MRAIFIAMLLALGIGLVGTAGSRAAPVDGAALLNAIEDLSSVEQARYHYRHHYRHRYRHYRHHHRHHYRHRYRYY